MYLMVMDYKRCLFSKKRARRRIAMTLLLSLLASSAVLVSVKVFVLDGLLLDAGAQEAVHGCDTPEKNSFVAITFDDAPSDSTDALIALLDSMDVKATFFVTGKNIKGREHFIQSIYQSGHDLGNHTWDYTGIGIKSARGAIEDVIKTEALIKEICGRATPFVRPPYNSISQEGYRALYGAQYRIIYYDIDSRDFFCGKKESVLGNISCAESGDIIRFHDGKTSPDVMREVIQKLRSMGLEPVAISTLLSD